MVEGYFEPDKIIARGIYNENYGDIKMFHYGEGWDNLQLKNDSLKFKEGFMDIGV